MNMLLKKKRSTDRFFYAKNCNVFMESILSLHLTVITKPYDYEKSIFDSNNIQLLFACQGAGSKCECEV